MLFKLSLKNIKKSFKDYAIYFLTLVLGVAIFYMFNSLDSQQAMLKVSESTLQLIDLMIQMLGMISIFVAIVLGLLIVYANNFLVNRRKKEFGIYMTLGMGKRQISKIILLETIFIGVISLVAGLVVGIFASQFMTILVSKIFEADLTDFVFVFSQSACIKTCIYFAIMYLAVMIFNTITISRYKLINLLTAAKKNEKIRIRNTAVCVIVFTIAVAILSYCYYMVTKGVSTLSTMEQLIPIIVLGTISTILIFWSLSGFILKMVQLRKKTYLKDANMFILRQINNKINTTVVSMSVICLMLFMTITVLSSALSIGNTMKKDLAEVTPVDINIYKDVNLPEVEVLSTGTQIEYTPEDIEESRISIIDTLENYDFDMSLLKEKEEISLYETKELTLADTMKSIKEELKDNYTMLDYRNTETIIKLSDYNKLAKLYNLEQFELKDDEYVMVCDFESMKELRNKVLEKDNTLTIQGKQYHSKYQECKYGFILISVNHMNTGFIVVPDSCNTTYEMKQRALLVGNYNATTPEEKQNIEKQIFKIYDSPNNNSVNHMFLNTKISIIESSVGTSTIVTFIAIYLGIIFLIASSAILALKQLTESSDNKERYMILRKIGADEKVINKSLFRQIGIFFMIPMILAIIHSIFGIQFALSMVSQIASFEELLPSVTVTIIIMGIVYGLYFIATYLESKNIIKKDNR